MSVQSSGGNDKPVVVISGEEPESGDEEVQESKELLSPKGRKSSGVKKPSPKSEKTKGTSGAKSEARSPNSSRQKVKVVTFGDEQKEQTSSPIEDDSDNEEEFGSTVSLASSMNSLEDPPGILRLDSEAAAVLGPILPQRTTHLDPSVIKKHRDRNRSLRINIADKFLTPVIIQSARKLERLSQNLSNSQSQMQDALFQSRLATGNMLKLQKHLEYFLEEDYLKELKILPTDDDIQDLNSDGNESNVAQSDRTVPQVQSWNSNHDNSIPLDSNSILSAALTRGAHLI